MNQQFLNIVDDIIRIGLFLYKDKEDPESYQKALENYLGYSLEKEFNNPYEILITYFKSPILKCFQYYLEKTEVDYTGQTFDLNLIENKGNKVIHLTIHRNQNSKQSITGINVNLDDIEFNNL